MVYHKPSAPSQPPPENQTDEVMDLETYMGKGIYNWLVIGPTCYYDVIDFVFVAKWRDRVAWQLTQNQ